MILYSVLYYTSFVGGCLVECVSKFGSLKGDKPNKDMERVPFGSDYH